MRKLAAVLLLVFALLLVPVGPSFAWTGSGGWHGGYHGGGYHGGYHGGGWYGGGYHGGGWYGGGWGWHGGWSGTVVVGGGPWWWGYPYAYPYAYPYPYYAPPYAYPYPSVSLQGPSVYVQQPPAPAAGSEAYWYYCASAKAYYPKVAKCSEAWIKVPSTPQ
jgi:hypothetical protein